MQARKTIIEKKKTTIEVKTIHFQIGIACVSSQWYYSIHIYPVWCIFLLLLSHWMLRNEKPCRKKNESNTYGTLTIHGHHTVHTRTRTHWYTCICSCYHSHSKHNVFVRNFWSYYTFVMCRFRNRINSWIQFFWVFEVLTNFISVNKRFFLV